MPYNAPRALAASGPDQTTTWERRRHHRRRNGREHQPSAEWRFWEQQATRRDFAAVESRKPVPRSGPSGSRARKYLSRRAQAGRMLVADSGWPVLAEPRKAAVWCPIETSPVRLRLFRRGSRRKRRSAEVPCRRWIAAPKRPLFRWRPRAAHFSAAFLLEIAGRRCPRSRANVTYQLPHLASHQDRGRPIAGLDAHRLRHSIGSWRLRDLIAVSGHRQCFDRF
jgi:hypothetical protein